VVVPGANGQAREREVAVGTAVERAVGAETMDVLGERPFDFAHLIVEVCARCIDDLLETKNVGIELLEDRDDAWGRDAAVEAASLMDVVGDDAKARGRHCWRSKIQPSSSGARSVMGRWRHSSSVTRRLWRRSLVRSASMRCARLSSRTARLTSSLRPKERLSKLVEPTTVQTLSTTRTLA